MDIRAHNRCAWDLQVERGNIWTVPVGPDAIADARMGRWDIFLTPTRPVPKAGFPPLDSAEPLNRYMPMFIATRAVKM